MKVDRKTQQHVIIPLQRRCSMHFLFNNKFCKRTELRTRNEKRKSRVQHTRYTLKEHDTLRMWQLLEQLLCMVRYKLSPKNQVLVLVLALALVQEQREQQPRKRQG